MEDSRRIKVLWLTKGLGPGGAERLLLSFAETADHERFDLHAAYLLPWKDHLVEPLQAAGVQVHRLDASHPADLRWARRLRSLVTRHRFDVVHDHSPLVAAGARIALRSLPKARRPVLVTTEHNVWDSHRPLTRILNQATMRLEDHVFAVSEEVRASMAPPQRVRAEALVHGVDVEAIATRCGERTEARSRLGLREDEFVVVTVANLRSNKDYPTMLQAARTLRDRGIEATFLSVGQGPLDADLRQRAERLGLGDSFRFLGYQSDPVGVLVAADVFCLSSRFEGLPIALLEALAAGVPAVVTDVGAMPSVVRRGVDGLVVPPGDPNRLAGALADLTDPTVRTPMAARASARSGEFDIRRAVDRQQAVYEDLAGRRRG